jgi:hypothetical protein
MQLIVKSMLIISPRAPPPEAPLSFDAGSRNKHNNETTHIIHESARVRVIAGDHYRVAARAPVIQKG